MEKVLVDPNKFKFKSLPGYAGWILREKLQDYVLASLRFSREEELPLLNRLSRFSEEELIAISVQSATEILSALENGTIHDHIRENVRKWISNTLEVIDRDEVVAEDLTMVGFIRRKAMSCFLPDYTDDHELKREILREIDVYTTQEELVSYNAYLRMQHEKMIEINSKLAFQEALLLDAQEISEMGSFFVDYRKIENSTVSPQMERITGLSQVTDSEEFFRRVHPDDVGAIREIWERALRDGGSFEYNYRYLRNGKMQYFLTRGIITIHDGKPSTLRGTLRDITKEYELIRRLSESEELHKQAQQLTHLGNWSWDIGTDSIQWSDEMYRIYGLEPQSEAITFDRFMSLIHPDNRATRMAEIAQALETGVAASYTLNIIAATGEHKILRGFGEVVKDSSGKPIRMVGTCQDITKEYRLNQEMVELNRSLSQKNRELRIINRELELFNYIASHDLQEPLRKIQIYSGRILEEPGNLEKQHRQSLEKVASSASRMQQLIADLIEFSQLNAPSEAMSRVSLCDEVEEAKNTFLLHFENGSAQIECASLPDIMAIPFQLRQLISNLIGNAIKYRKPDVPCRIRIDGEIVDAKDIAEGPNNLSGTFFKISFCDNGIGFEPGQAENIFGLFKRLHTADSYSGTGIGLAICKKIAQNHGGFIRARGQEGEGACFDVYFPEDRIVKQV